MCRGNFLFLNFLTDACFGIQGFIFLLLITGACFEISRFFFLIFFQMPALELSVHVHMNTALLRVRRLCVSVQAATLRSWSRCVVCWVDSWPLPNPSAILIEWPAWATRRRRCCIRETVKVRDEYMEWGWYSFFNSLQRLVWGWYC